MFNRGMLGVLAGLVLFGSANAQEASGGAATDLPIAVQLYTLRDYGSTEEQIAFAAESGFTHVETFNHEISVEDLQTVLEETGVSVISAHYDIGTLRDDLDGVVAYNEALGNENIVMPYLAEEDRPTDAAGWAELGAELGEIGAELKEAGMQFAYHNHDFEMEEIDGTLIIDHLLGGAADPETLMWQADVAWIDRGGQNPTELLTAHAGRVISIHAKDNYPEGEGEDEGGFATVGSGTLDWDAILPAAAEAGVQYYIVEHDSPVDYATIADSYTFLSQELPGVLGQ